MFGSRPPTRPPWLESEGDGDAVGAGPTRTGSEGLKGAPIPRPFEGLEGEEGRGSSVLYST